MTENFDAYIDMLDPVTEEELFGEDEGEEEWNEIDLPE